MGRIENVNFPRHEESPTAAALAIRAALTKYADGHSDFGNSLNRIFDDCPYQDMGQAMVNQIYGPDEIRMEIFFDLPPRFYLPAICAAFAHDAMLAESHGYSNPWPLIAHSMYWYGLTKCGATYDEIAKEVRIVDARKRANRLHDKPGGSREKRAAISAAWATGKYSSRDICAEQESAALGMSFSAARKALRNTPDPT